jgi:hypothetical protein
VSVLARSLAAARSGVARSDLARAGGFAVVRLVDDDGLRRLQEEARAAEAAATTYKMAVHGGGEQRGHAARWMATTAGGPVLDALLCAPHVLDHLAAVTGVTWRPNGRLGTYSYYREPGHFLGIHRDVRGCDLALITCLWDTGGAGGDLVVYPGAARRRLAEVRAEPRRGAHRVALAPGESAILLGGIVPHRVSPTGPAHARAVAPLCYRLAVAG